MTLRAKIILAAFTAAASFLVTATVTRADETKWVMGGTFQGPTLGDGTYNAPILFPDEASCRNMVGSPSELEARKTFEDQLKTHDPDVKVTAPTCAPIVVETGTPI